MGSIAFRTIQAQDNKCKMQTPRETKLKTAVDPYTKQNLSTIESDKDYHCPHHQPDIIHCMYMIVYCFSFSICQREAPWREGGRGQCITFRFKRESFGGGLGKRERKSTNIHLFCCLLRKI